MLFGTKPTRHFEGELVDAPTWFKYCNFKEWSYQPHLGTIEIAGEAEDGRRMVFIAVEQKKAARLQEITWQFSFMLGAFFAGASCYIEYEGGYTAQTYLQWAPFAAAGIAIFFAASSLSKLVARVLNWLNGGSK
jgi:hypothetical protein